MSTGCDLAAAFGIFAGFLVGLAVDAVVFWLAYRVGIIEHVGLPGEER